MEYHFDIEHAQKYGLNEAIMIYNLRFWILKNKANERHQYDGRTWTYNSIPAFEELFPFWSYYQIKRILTSLVEKGVLVKGNYNASGYDKTSWYAFADESLFINASCIGQKETIDEAKSPDGRGENASPIPDNKQQIKNADKKLNKGVPTKQERFKKDIQNVYEELNLTTEWQDVFNTWFEYKIERKECLTPMGIKSCIKKYMAESNRSTYRVQAGIENSMANNYQGLILPKEDSKPKIGIDGISIRPLSPMDGLF